MEKAIKFFDFCSGIGGGRIGLERNGFECVGHSEIDPNTAETYKRFFNDERNFGDLTKIKIGSMPDFDMMIAGFPCQSFSIVGKREGFKDSRGQIIYFLIEIMKKKNIKYFILENVKGLVNHDKGNTLRTIKKEIEDAGYNLYVKILNSIDFGVPQMRERIYLIGFKKEIDNCNFEFPKEEKIIYNLEDYIDAENELELKKDNETFKRYLNNKYNIEENYRIEDILK